MRSYCLAILSMVLSGLAVTKIHAADYTWIGTTTNWTTTSNWSPAGAPGSSSSYTDRISFTAAKSPSSGLIGTSGLGSLGTGGRYVKGISVAGASTTESGKGQFNIMNSNDSIYLRIHSEGVSVSNPASGIPADLGIAQPRLAADQTWFVDEGRLFYIGTETTQNTTSPSLTIEGSSPVTVNLTGNGEVRLGAQMRVAYISPDIKFVFGDPGRSPRFNMGGKALVNELTINNGATLTGAAAYEGKLKMAQNSNVLLDSTTLTVRDDWDIAQGTSVSLSSSTLDLTDCAIPSAITASGESGVKGNKAAGGISLANGTVFTVENRALHISQFDSIGSDVTFILKNSSFNMGISPPRFNLIIAGPATISGSGDFSGQITVMDGCKLDIEGGLNIQETGITVEPAHIAEIDGTVQPDAVSPMSGNYSAKTVRISFTAAFNKKIKQLAGEHTYVINLNPGCQTIELVNSPDIVTGHSYNTATGKLTISADVPPLPPLPPVAGSRPNIIFILVDDMGWGDLGINWTDRDKNGRDVTRQNEYATPTLDQLAREGIQLRRHYTAAPVCAPARASVILGVHQGHSRQVRNNNFDHPVEESHTLGTVLRGAGYSTAVVGKWGVGGGGESGFGMIAAPHQRGFDFFYGIMDHRAGHYHYLANSQKVYEYDSSEPSPSLKNVESKIKKTAYSTDLFTARAKKWITDQQSATPDKPFFLYLAYTAPHASLRVPNCPYPEGKGLRGGVQWKDSGSVNTEDMPPSSGGTTPVADSYIHPDNANFANDVARRHSTMVRRVDDAVADIIQLLKDLNIDENTLIVFTSDNGPHDESGIDSGANNGMPGVGAQNPTYFKTYAMMDGIKRDCWEGGMRVPAIVRWPAYIPDSQISLHPSQFHDWMATFAQAAGVPVPARSDGVSLLPTLIGETEYQQEGNIYIEYDYSGTTSNYGDFLPGHIGTSRSQQQVVFMNGYKGIRKSTTSTNNSDYLTSTDFQIYDTATDPQETTNLAASMPGLQTALKAKAAGMRREGSTTDRPYGKILIPGVLPTKPTEQGLKWKAYRGTFNWVPDFRQQGTCDAEGTTTTLTPNLIDDAAKGVEFTGYLEIPTDGTYEFYLTTDSNSGSKAFVHLHEMQLIDADFTYVPGTEVSSTSTMGTSTADTEAKRKVHLKAGKHPIRIGYVGNTSNAALSISWSGPGIAKQTIPAAQFSYEPELRVAPSAVSIDRNTPSPHEVQVFSNSSWTASTSNNWITLTEKTGTGNGVFHFTCSPNTSPASRTGSISVGNTEGEQTDVVVIQASMLVPYDEWGKDNFGDDYGNEGTGKNDSYRGDGNTNLLKYGLGIDPKKPCGSPGTASLVDKNDGQYLRVVYPYNQFATGISYEGQASEDLINWNETLPVQFAPEHGKLYIDDSEPASDQAGARKFLRLRVFETPAAP